MKETWDKTMQEKLDQCARAEDMVAYLYKEATPAQAKDFESHMQHCASCRREMTAFGDVREAIGEWRQQALGTLSVPAFEVQAATAFAAPSETPRQRRNALAALSEFFTLSPVWMRAAAAAVVLVFCALAIIAITHLSEQPKVVFVERPTETNIQREVNKQEVAGAVEPSPEVTANQKNKPAPKVNVANNEKRVLRPVKRSAISSQQLAKQRKQVLPHSIVKPSDQLASANDFLPFTAQGREEKLPTLVDLVDEPN